MGGSEQPQEIHDEGIRPEPKVAELKKTIAIDTIRNDEALKVLGNYSGEAAWAELEEKKLRRKIDKRLLPILMATYGLQYYDKSMLSQAVGN